MKKKKKGRRRRRRREKKKQNLRYGALKFCMESNIKYEILKFV